MRPQIEMMPLQTKEVKGAGSHEKLEQTWEDLCPTARQRVGAWPC